MFHILVVEDDTNARKLMKAVLERAEYRVSTAGNGEEALALLDTQHVDLIVLDIMMPGMDGYDAMRAIRAQARFQHLPIIALTAKAMKEDRQKCLDAGANEYLSKPVDLEQLVALLRLWIA